MCASNSASGTKVMKFTGEKEADKTKGHKKPDNCCDDMCSTNIRLPCLSQDRNQIQECRTGPKGGWRMRSFREERSIHE